MGEVGASWKHKISTGDSTAFFFPSRLRSEKYFLYDPGSIRAAYKPVSNQIANRNDQPL